MLDERERVIEPVEQLAPLPVLLRLSEADGVVFKAIPLHEKQVGVSGLHRSRERQRLKAGHGGDDHLRFYKRRLELTFHAGRDGKDRVFGDHRTILPASRPFSVIPSYTFVMKTAISLPDDTFDRASRRAKALGMSRSEFFARAAVNYLDELDARSLTARMDAALHVIGETDESTDLAVNAGRRVLGDSDEW